MEPTTAALIAMMLPGLASLVLQMFGWSLKRNVKKDDEEQKAQDLELKELRDQLAALKLELRDTVNRTDWSALTTILGDIKTSIAELRQQMKHVEAEQNKKGRTR